MSNSKQQEQTGQQVFQSALGSPNKELNRVSWWKKLRQLKKDPTIRMVRNIWPAPIFAAAWTYKASKFAPEGAREAIRDSMETVRNRLLRNAAFGCMDWGWSAFEVIYGPDREGHLVPKKVKPLLQQLTEIQVYEDNGEFAGFIQDASEGTTETVEVDQETALLISFDEEGTDWYGNSVMGAVEESFDDSQAIRVAGNEYDRKISGTHWVVKYPAGGVDDDGEGVHEVGGQRMNNFELAKYILRGLEASGGIAVPSSVKSFVEELEGHEAMGWDISLIEAGTSAATSFDLRNQRQDKLKVRAFGIPERAILETQYGTKADAGEHADFAISAIEFRHAGFLEQINEQLVDEILRENWGEEAVGSVRIVAAPLVDAKRDFLTKLFMQIIASDPELAQQEYDSIDWNEFKELLGIPESDTSDLDDDEDLLDDPLLDEGEDEEEDFDEEDIDFIDPEEEDE